jgi:hypothetical protein
VEGENYPDYGCTFETFTNQEMIEIESLSPLVRLKPGATLHHVESWRFFPGESIPLDDDSAFEKLSQLRSQL